MYDDIIEKIDELAASRELETVLNSPPDQQEKPFDGGWMVID